MKLIIGFSRPKEGFVPFAKAIMWYQGTEYSHAFVRFHDEFVQRDLIYQASSTMVNFWGGTYFDSKEITVAAYEIEVSAEKWVEIRQYFIDNAGLPYSMAQIFGILVYKKTGKKIFQNGGKEFICSEMVGRIIKDLNVLEIDMDLDYVMPSDVKEMLDLNPAVFKKII